MTTAKLTRVVRDNLGRIHHAQETVTIKSSVTQMLGDDRRLWRAIFADGTHGALWDGEFEPTPDA